MALSPLSPDPAGPGLRALAGGLRGSFDAQHLRTVLDVAGLGDPDLARAVDALEAESQAVVEAGARLAGDGLRGALIDLLA